VTLKQLVPLRTRRYARTRELELRRSLALRRGVASLKRHRRASQRTLDRLVFGWGNAWSAETGFLLTMASAAIDEPGPILECGSGLTTLVLAALRHDRSESVFSLEHDPDWFRFLASRLRRYGLEANAKVHLAPLRDFGGFEWYDVSGLELPSVSLVVCDGPPNSTRGGRFGLVPVLGNRLAPDCTILLDDASRAEEQDVLRRWRRDTPLTYEVLAEERPFALVQLERTGATAE
jgi:Methyltransferase domain